MFMPYLLLRYAGMLFTAVGVFFGQPSADALLKCKSGFSVPLREEVPLAINKRRGSLDLSRRGTKVAVMIWVPTVLTFQDAFHVWPIFKLPAWNF